MAQIRRASDEARWIVRNVCGDSSGAVSYPVDVLHILDVLDVDCRTDREFFVHDTAVAAVVSTTDHDERSEVALDQHIAQTDEQNAHFYAAVALGMIRYSKIVHNKNFSGHIRVDDDSDEMDYALNFAREMVAPADEVKARHKRGFGVRALSRIFNAPDGIIADVLLS